jgi:probable rRNA maturation factor
MIKLNFYIGSRYPVNRKKLRATAEKVLSEYKIDNAQLDLSVVGTRKIKSLNEERLNHSGVTDVLSFPHHEKNKIDDFPIVQSDLPHLGDIVICYPKAINDARRYGKKVDDQLCFYLEHGLMHLLGYHHND